MSFKKEVNNILSKYLHTNFADYRYTLVSGTTLYLEGHNGVLSFETNAISFRLSKKELVITGVNLTISEFDKTTAVIIGEIQGVSIK